MVSTVANDAAGSDSDFMAASTDHESSDAHTLRLSWPVAVRLFQLSGDPPQQ
jgi:hypothetical protein